MLIHTDQLRATPMTLVAQSTRRTLADTLLVKNHDPLRDVPGVAMLNSHHATWSVDDLIANIACDALDELRVRLPRAVWPSPHDSLAANTRLPGNWRWAESRGERVLLADVSATLRDSLPVVFSEWEASARDLCRSHSIPADATEPLPTASTIDKKDLLAALQAPWWNDQTVTEIADGWELRPTVGSQPIPVTLHIAGDRVRCRRDIVVLPAARHIADGIHLLALRLNARIKHARLARVERKLVAEACLHRDLIAGQTLAEMARAVAVAAHRVRASLGILREHEEIATLFATLFAAPDLVAGEIAAPDLPHSPRKGGI